MKTIFLAFSITDSSVTDYFLELSNQLSESYKVVVIADHIEPHSFFVSPKLTILKWPSDRPKNFADFVFLFKNVWKHKPSVMISMFGSVNMFSIVGFLLRVKHRIAWCRTVSAASNAKKSMKRRKALIYKLSTVLIANSNTTKQDLIENFAVNPEKIKVIYNAVSQFKVDKSFNRDKLVYVGSLIPMKGVDTLLEAMPAVLKEFPSVKLTMVGGYIGGNSMKHYQEKANSLGIGENILFLGRLDKKRVLDELSNAYFSVAPSLAEAFGFNVIESFSVKTPVIGSDSSGIAEIIENNADGFLFKTKNSRDLSEKMIELLNNPSLRDKFSANCYQHFLTDFEVRSGAAKVVKYIANLQS